MPGCRNAKIGAGIDRHRLQQTIHDGLVGAQQASGQQFSRREPPQRLTLRTAWLSAPAYYAPDIEPRTRTVLDMAVTHEVPRIQHVNMQLFTKFPHQTLQRRFRAVQFATRKFPCACEWCRWRTLGNQDTTALIL